MDCIQRKIVVRPCPTTISSCFEGFRDDHFAVILKPLCGERGIRTPGTSQFNGFQDRRNRPLCHLSMVNFTPFEAHPQGRVEGLTATKIVYFGECARVCAFVWCGNIPEKWGRKALGVLRLLVRICPRGRCVAGEVTAYSECYDRV